MEEPNKTDNNNTETLTEIVHGEVNAFLKENGQIEEISASRVEELRGRILTRYPMEVFAPPSQKAALKKVEQALRHELNIWGYFARENSFYR